MLTEITLVLTGVVLVLAAAAIIGSIWSFRAQKPADYADTGPAIDIRQHLAGRLICEGMLYDYTGRVNSRFTAEMTGNWEGERGSLAERFVYETGRKHDREWTLKVGNDGAITAEAPDIVGIGRGVQSGATAQLKYRIRLPEDAGGHVLDVVDWMYLAPNGTVMNRSEFRKFGIRVAMLFATMRKAA